LDQGVFTPNASTGTLNPPFFRFTLGLSILKNDDLKSSNAEVSGDEAVRYCDWLDFVCVNILAIGDSENKDIKTQQGIYHPAVTDAILAKSGKLSLEYRIGLRLFDQFPLNEVKDSFRLGFR
jgi:hypothetical protein